MPNFSKRDFIKRGLLGAIGKQADYKIILSAKDWIKKKVLEPSDLEEIQAALNTMKMENR